MLVQLLKRARPEDFRAFEDFARWRDVLAHVLADNLGAPQDEGAWGGEAEGDKEALRVDNARLRGAVRRLQVPKQSHFEEQEYAEAAANLDAVAAKLARSCPTGWSFPWRLQTRIWRALLLTSFDYVRESASFDRKLRGCLAPVLGIGPGLHMACTAWVHFQRFVASGVSKDVAHVQHLLRQLREVAEASVLTSVEAEEQREQERRFAGEVA
ncbi:unnamed protein product, partial [Ostreobium quekettii]